MKRIILTNKQLNEYIEKRKSEDVFYKIINDLHNSNKFLNENVSVIKTNQSIIDSYNQKGLINKHVFEMLFKAKVIDNDYKII